MPEINNIPSNEENISQAPKNYNIDTARLAASNKEAEYIIRGFALQRLQTKFFKVGDQRSDKKVSEGDFGLPVFSNLKFGNIIFEVPDDNAETELKTAPINLQGITLDTVLMTVSMNKNIVKTAVQGRNGTVKEYISDGDFEIDVKGVIVGEGQNEYPGLDVEELIRVCTAPVTLKIEESDFLTRFNSINPNEVEGISEVVITDFVLPQREGFRNAQLFQFKMLSNTPIELTI
jgi:hypothetical protein